MDEYVDAIIQIKVPKWQIGEEVSIHFPDTMMKKGKCETLDESVIQEVLNKRCMTAVANEYLVALHGKRSQGKWEYVQYDGNANIGNWHCSECGRIVFDHIRYLYRSYSKKPYYNFCPNCGANMRGAE